MGLVLLMAAAVAGVAVIAFARQKAPRASTRANAVPAPGLQGPRPSQVVPPLVAQPAPLDVVPRPIIPLRPSPLPTAPAGQQNVVREDVLPLPPVRGSFAPARELEPRGAQARAPNRTTNPQTTFTPQRPGASTTCVCPACGTRVPHDGHLYCPGARCPNCGGSMLPGVVIGGDGPPPPKARVAVNAPPVGNTVTTPPGQQPVARGELVAAAGPTYDTTVAPIVARNCLRCHGGPVRNLGTYQNLKQYATNGLLSMMIQPGGPMSHFLTPTEAQSILDWIQTGEPR